MLPDALLEDTVFSNGDEVKDLFKQLSQLKKVGPGVDTALKAYGKICTIRHCCVHRFGRLGVKNAVHLGLEEHKAILEHAFAPKIGDLENMATAAHNLVLEFNRSVFRATLERLADPRTGVGADWTWNLNSDRRRFSVYYDLFAIQEGDPKSPDLNEIYRSYRDWHRPSPEARRKLTER